MHPEGLPSTVTSEALETEATRGLLGLILAISVKGVEEEAGGRRGSGRCLGSEALQEHGDSIRLLAAGAQVHP